MRPHATRVGLLLLFFAGAVWGIASARVLDPVEAFLCSTMGIGFGLAAWGIRRHPHALATGIAIAALPSGYWLVDAFAAGDWTSLWALFGGGVVVAALSGLARGNGRSLGLRAGLGVTALASLLLLLLDDPASAWTAGHACALGGAGTVALSWREADPPRD